jgi:hypothetical protein
MNMNMNTKPSTILRDPTENDLLVEFERQQIPEHYKPYYLPKRHNLFATIQQFPYIWNVFMHLDKIVLREFEVMQRMRDPNLMLTMVLLMNAHSKVRVAFELACSTCVPEGHSILRDAIESAAHGHRLASDPQLLKAWLAKNDSEAAKKVFSQEFEYEKAARLFDSLPELHKLWKQFSEFGSHININSIISKFVVSQTDTDMEFRLNYSGVADARFFAMVLFEMVLVFSEIEKVIFKLAKDRLQFDHELLDMRSRFEKEKEAVRQHIIKTFDVQPPSAPAVL